MSSDSTDIAPQKTLQLFRSGQRLPITRGKTHQGTQRVSRTQATGSSLSLHAGTKEPGIKGVASSDRVDYCSQGEWFAMKASLPKGEMPGTLAAILNDHFFGALLEQPFRHRRRTTQARQDLTFFPPEK